MGIRGLVARAFRGVGPRGVQDKNQKWFIRYALGVNTNANLVAGVFLSGYLAYIGVDETTNGILMAIPVLATVFQPIGAIMGSSRGNLKRHVLTYTIPERVLCCLLYSLPLFFLAGRSLMVAAIYLVANIGTALITPSANEWMMNIVKPEQRHEFFGRREIVMLVALMIAVLAGGGLMDIADAYDARRLAYFILTLVIAGLSALVLTSILHIEPNAPGTTEKAHLSSLLVPLRDKRFMTAMAAICMYQFAVQLAAPYWSIYQLGTLKLSYSYVNIITVVGLSLRVFALRFLMKYLRQRSWSWIFGASVGVLGLGHFLNTFLYHGNGTWYIWVPAFFSNLGWGFLGIALLNFQYDNIEKEDRSLYMAVGAVMTGLVGFGASLVGGAVLEGVNALRELLPWFSMAGQQVQMCLSGILLVCTGLLLARLRKREKVC